MRFDINRWWAKTQFNDNVRIRLYRKLSTLLTNGVPILEALNSLYKKASLDGKKKSDPVAVIINEWIRATRNGDRLSKAMESWVPEGERMLISAGESSGSIEASLISVCKGIKSKQQVKSSIIGAVAYPILLSFVTVGILWVFGTKVIPQLARVSKPETWQGTAKGLYVMSNVVQDWTIPILLAIVVIAILIALSMPKLTGKLRVYLDKIPPWSIYRMWIGGDFITSLASLQKAGTPLEKSLLELRTNSSDYLRERLDSAIRGLRSGLNLGESLAKSGHGFPDPEVVDDISTYASLSGFDAALEQVSDDWLESGIESIQSQAKLMNGISIMFMGVVIAWIASGLFAIQQQIASSVKGF